MKLVIFGLTITSAWGNGHATTFRSLVKALAHRGHTITFVEKEAEWYRQHRDLPHPPFCKLMLYEDWQASASGLLAEAADADAIVIGSYFPDAIVATQALAAGARVPLYFYDIDTPITLAALRTEGRCAYLDRASIPLYTAYLSFSGGPVLAELEQHFGARRAVAFYCSVDAELYRPVPVQPSFRCDLSYLGTYAADRQPGLERLLTQPAAMLAGSRFLVAGAQYPATLAWGKNITHLQHVGPAEHAAFYSSARFSLNLTRAEMIAAGYSPSVRLFEASACGATILSDTWPGFTDFLTPGEQILLPEKATDVAHILSHLSDEERLKIGARARERILAEHTADHRAQQFEAIVGTAPREPNQPRA